MPVVTLYGKPGCHLCDDARAVVERVREQRPFELEEVDVSLDPVLHTATASESRWWSWTGRSCRSSSSTRRSLRERLDRVISP